MVKIITDSYFNSIINSDLYLAHNYLMKYPEYAGRFKRLWNESDAPKTQKELAKWLDYSQPMINYWLNGEKLPSMDTAIKIANKFGVCVEWLITGKGSVRPDDRVNLQRVIDITDLSDEDAVLVATLAAKLSQNKQNNHLTTQSQNVGGGGAETRVQPEPKQQQQSQDRRQPTQDRRMARG